MKFGKSRNPFMKQFESKGETVTNNEVLDTDLVRNNPIERADGGLMTVGGAVNKTLILFGVMLVGAVAGAMFPFFNLMLVYSIAGAVVYFIASRNPAKAPVLAPIFALFEGLLVGTASILYASLFSGIVFHAATITFALLFLMLALYKTGLIKVTQKFRAGVTMAVGAVMMLYLVNIALYMFGISIPFLHDGGMISIGIAAVIIVIACMNLLLDFDNFEKGEQAGAPQHMEWYFGMGLLFTIVWLYLEILRFLSYFMGEE